MDEKEQEEAKRKAEEEAENKRKENAAGTSDDGTKTRTTPLIDIANQAAKRMEDANLKTEELLNRQEEMDSRRALGGTTEAGKEEGKEYTDEEKASRERIKQIGEMTASPWAKNYE